MPAKKYFTKEEARAGANARRRITRPKIRERTNELARASYAKNREKIREQRRQARLRNLEHHRAMGAKYRKLYADKIPMWQKEYAKRNKEAVAARAKKYRKNNPEKHREFGRSWNKRNHDKVLAMNANVRARRRSRMHPGADKRAIMVLFKEARALTKSTGIPHHVDHIIPLCRGGWHHQDNMQVLVKRLNMNDPSNGGKGVDPFWLAPHAGIKDWRDVPRHLWPIDLVPKYLALIEQHKGESIRWDVAA